MQYRTDVRIELLRILGALSVFVYHFMGDAETVLRPGFERYPLWNAIRIGSGPFGVSLFIIISGVVFTWSWPRAGNPFRFIQRRLSALFPLYWWIALPLIALALFTRHMQLSELWKALFWLTGLNILSPITRFPVVNAWWYMTLALQMVLAYPILRRLQDGIGLPGFMIGSAAVTIGSTWVLSYLGLGYVNLGFIGPRLVDFAFGMTIGSCVGTGVRAWPSGSILLTTGAALWACILGLPGTPAQNALAPLVALLTLGLIRNSQGSFGRLATAMGGLTFAFYLSHSPWAKPILASVSDSAPTASLVIASATLSLIVAGLVAWGFQSSFIWARGVSTRILASTPEPE